MQILHIPLNTATYRLALSLYICMQGYSKHPCIAKSKLLESEATDLRILTGNIYRLDALRNKYILNLLQNINKVYDEKC